jgi:hypothetical protein
MALGTGVGAAVGYGAAKGLRKGIRKGHKLIMAATDRAVAKSGKEIAADALLETLQGRQGRNMMTHTLLPAAYRFARKRKTIGALAAVGAAGGAIITARREGKRDQRIRITMGPKTRATMEKFAAAMHQGRIAYQAAKSRPIHGFGGLMRPPL